VPRLPTNLLLMGLLFISSAALAQQKPKPAGFPDAPGKETLLGKCFQCHGPGMWMDHRQDRKGWVGRGALWSEGDIKAMADYLAAAYGRKAQ
jgi:mono/diheme cytochrome c family protein